MKRHQAFSSIKTVSYANDILDLILKPFVIASGGVAGLFWLLKTLKGKKPEKVEKTDNGIALTINGDVFLVDKRVTDLYKNPEVRQQCDRFTKVLERPGINSLEFSKDTGEKLKIHIKESERQYFTFPEGDDREVKRVEKGDEQFLQALSIHFKEGNKWRFTDGETEFNAKIEDVDFINKIDKGEIQFLKGDVYVCKVLTVQTLTSKGLKQERTILEVLEHQSGAHQLKLI